MIESPEVHYPEPSTTAPTHRWHPLADQVLDRRPLSRREALDVLGCPDEQLLELLAAAFRVRRHYFGVDVKLHFLISAKTGLCPEDCGYCSQSKVSKANLQTHKLLDRKELLAGAKAAEDRKAGTYCIVLSGRGPTERELDALKKIIPEIKHLHPLKICVSIGLLNAEQAQRLKACGVDRVNHNLNTSRDYYAQICTTHSFEDRLATLCAVRDAGLEICSGGIVGMGETPDDIVEMALTLRDLSVESIPINFLNPIDGTPLEAAHHLNPRDCLKVLAMFRLVHPDRDIRIAGGRELRLGALQPLGLYAANSIFVGDYLTTRGQPPTADYKMIQDLGFRVEG
jgi:biotin synthase